jgi:hypothetical protein
MSPNWRDISYLAHGTPRQREAFSCLTEMKVFDVLHEFDPILVSTVCLDIDVPSSDLDIICEVRDADRFEVVVTERFGQFRGFRVNRSETDPTAIVCQLFTDAFEIELFGQPVPTEQQNAYRHLVQINRVISLGGPKAREAVRALKSGGIKTEPAVAQLLQLEGDPYRAVLNLERESDETIVLWLARYR